MEWENEIKSGSSHRIKFYDSVSKRKKLIETVSIFQREMESEGEGKKAVFKFCSENTSNRYKSFL